MTKKILITGINGFIGSNCAKYFKRQNYDVYGIDIFGNLENNFVQGEADLNNLRKFNTKFDVILHLAGTGQVSISQKNPEIERTKTVKSSVDLVEYMQKYNKNARLIYISSAAIYGNKHNGPIKEEAEYAPISIYGEHKKEVEEFLLKTNDIDYQIIRLFSVYGEGLRKQVLWDFCNKVKNNISNKQIECFGTGDEQRDFIHIDDVAQLIHLAINSAENKMIINGATGKAIKIADIFKAIKNLFEYDGELCFNNEISENNPKCLVADIEKSKKLGYRPKVELQYGLRRYVEWFKEI